VASQHSLDGAATPPHEEGNFALGMQGIKKEVEYGVHR